jgi:glycosyltransferase involved in cell wall biosynthesis
MNHPPGFEPAPASGPLRVLVLLEAYTISGSAKGVLEYAREELRQRRECGAAPAVELTLVTFRRGGQDLEQPVLRDAIEELAMGREVVEESRRFDLAAVDQLREIHGRVKPHVVWSNSVKSHFLVRLAGLHQTSGWLAVHHGYTATDWKMHLYNQLDRWSLRAARQAMTVCQPFAQQLREHGVANDRILVQHMPIRPGVRATAAEVAALRAQLGIGTDEKVIFTAGRLSREKGHLELVEAFAALLARQEFRNHLRLVIAGEGPERQALLDLARQQGIAEDRLILAGQQADLKPYYGMAQVFALPSHSEGSPNVLLEAMAAGVPVVASRVGGIPEMAEDGVSALLTPKCDVTALAAALQRVLTEPALANRLTAGAGPVLSSHTPAGYHKAVTGALRNAVLTR